MDAPIRMLAPELIAPDTHVIRQLAGEGMGPVATFVNSMVITGAEPVIVDCGPAVSREAWLETVFGLVEPEDVRWIFLSHDDVDHTGNLPPVLEACPQATLVTNWFSMERMAADYQLPLDRMRWVNGGERFHAGDRDLVAVVPPTFDSPTTRGLFDTRTGVYWAADSFVVPVTHEVTSIGELDPGFFRQAFLDGNRMLSPWHQWMDPAKYVRHLGDVQAIGATAVASAHAPTYRDGEVDSAFRLLQELPYLPEVAVAGAVRPRCHARHPDASAAERGRLTADRAAGASASPPSPPGVAMPTPARGRHGAAPARTTRSAPSWRRGPGAGRLGSSRQDR